MKKFLSIAISLAVVFTMSATAFAAEGRMTIDEAKEYLQTYNVTKTNELGKEYTTQYIFNSEDDLNKAAAYIASNGLADFNAALNNAVAEVVSKEPQSAVLLPRSTNPTTVRKTVSGNGSHSVSAESYGLASFDTLGTSVSLSLLNFFFANPIKRKNCYYTKKCSCYAPYWENIVTKKT